MEEPTWSRSTQCVPYIYYYARYMHTHTHTYRTYCYSSVKSQRSRSCMHASVGPCMLSSLPLAPCTLLIDDDLHHACMQQGTRAHLKTLDAEQPMDALRFIGHHKYAFICYTTRTYISHKCIWQNNLRIIYWYSRRCSSSVITHHACIHFI